MPSRDFVSSGGNAAWFAANLCWWRVHLVDKGRALVCHQGGPRGAFDHWWPSSGAARPEDSLGGVSYRHGGGWWDGARQTSGFIVQQPGHWVFEGTGLRHGDSFGADTWPPLAGYECDGVPLDKFDPTSGVATLSAWSDQDGTPDDYQLLAACPLDHRWQELPARARHAAGEGVHAATLGLFHRGGTVFSSGTTDWAQVLADGRDRRVERITRNVLDRLLRY
ncbi:N,N-dimethylformamidase beta subunit family domain-containing protein [Massilia sp. Dwa41.01b]|uniref:N,N-dimethylformamidase beta subunit family domain-containing protein n=1 Tax=Massilia sp. Dwa41.01b TaxID=2709302 RepID=UPI001E53B251|nr:N,N-dimethylformamidase beta subunit family domain-containing protein [Massilia sp. Dwa41.01b]